MSTACIGKREYFPNIQKIQYEGPQSKNPLAFHHYDENRKIRGKSMKEHLRFSVAYWHTFGDTGEDPFGNQTKYFPWEKSPDVMTAAKDRLDAAFEFMTKLGVPFYCFHDRDLAPEGRDVQESEERLEELVDLAAEKQKESGIHLLWGTANLFSHPRYMNGAASNPDFLVVAHAAAQVKAALDATHKLGGKNYVFWGGREGYSSLLNTDMKRELDHLAVFFKAAVQYGRAIGFDGTFLIEPKPMEPSKHQYDFDTATVVAFLRTYGLDTDFKINIENNHATLANHTFAHELQVAADADLLGSVDANQGDPQNGWDTDEFLHDIYQAIRAMLVILPYGGLGNGGLNFDARTRRNSTDLEDSFIGHIQSMDTFARALYIADRILTESDYLNLKKARYSTFDQGHGAEYEKNKLSLQNLRDIAADLGEPALKSGKQELYERLINQYL
ncbi:xylose isomerase [candidate division KSB1 bacterium]|nr:xylose isomerase [candidate division KSB1 bacterium]